MPLLNCNTDMKNIAFYFQKISAAGRVSKFYVKYTTAKYLHLLKRKLPNFKKNHLRSFPAVSLKKLDFLDYLASFSTELILLTLVFSIAGLNFYFFTLKPHASDNSLASVFLSYHHKEGDKLYGKLAAIKTTVEHNRHSFIAEAYADTLPYLTTNTANETLTSEDTHLLFDSNYLTKPNPDTVANLIAKQIQVHIVQEGENLAAIAKQYNISPNTIIWANKLTNSTVQPGWHLLILPTDGVLVKADSNTTLPDIAYKYKCNLDTIIAYNGLDGADDIEEGRLIIAPGCKVPPPPQIAKPSKPKPKTGSPRLTQLGKHIFPVGYCTYYVASRMEIDFGGNANVWHINAQRSGYTTGDIPVAGSAVVTTDGPRRYGHVAYVEKVTDSAIIISEMNYSGWNKINTRSIPLGSKKIVKYIYPK